MKLLLKGGRIIDPSQNIDSNGDLLIVDGRVAAVGDVPHAEGAVVIDVKGLVVAPGLVDMHTHLREPGLEYKEDIYSGARAAAAGGFTTIACMPNTRPVVDNAALVRSLIHRAGQDGVAHVRVIGAVTKGQEGRELAEIGDMLQAGAVALSDDGHYVESARVMRTALEYAGMFGGMIISHAEEETLAGEGLMHEGAVSSRLGLRGRPSVAEDIAVARDILLAEYTGSAIHIAHVSTAGAVELIRQAKKRGVKVTAEATPPHLTLTDEAVTGFESACKVNPPLRSAEHVAALLAGLTDRTVDMIASDHAPHAFEEKDREFGYAPSGFSGLETSLAVVLTALYHDGRFDLSGIIDRMATTPARLFGLDAGTLQLGAPGDVVIIDPDVEWTVDSSKFYTRGKSTPFEGRSLRGRAVATILGGRVVMKDGEVYEWKAG